MNDPFDPQLESPVVDEPPANLETEQVIRHCYVCNERIYWGKSDNRVPLCLNCFGNMKVWEFRD